MANIALHKASRKTNSTTLKLFYCGPYNNTQTIKDDINMGLFIETERLIIREFISEDADALKKFASKEYITQWLPDWLGCEEWALPWIEGSVKNGYKTDNPMIDFLAYAVVLKSNNILIGQVGCGNFKKIELGIGYFINEHYSNRGFTTEAMKSFVECIFEKYGYEYLIATIQPKNFSSVAIAKKLGFEYVETINILDNGQTEILPFNYYRLYRTVYA